MKMKRVSATLFFAVLCKGLGQALESFLELFGYKKDGQYAKGVWGLFAINVTVIVTILAIVLVWSIGETIYDKYYREAHCYDPDCNNSRYISDIVYYHDTDDGKGYIFNSQTREKTIRHIKWIAVPEDDDSLICFNNGEKRGYFSKYTGKVAIEPKYGHAWVFSEGMASVEEGGYIKFIDGTGKVMIDKKMPYVPNMDGYMFHGGYCKVKSDDKLYGLMDKTGKLVLPQEYDEIELTAEYGMWTITKGKEMGVLDKDLNPILSLSECSIYLGEGTIDVSKPDHTVWKYDMQGRLMNDFYVYNIQMLEYEKPEVVYRNNITQKVDEDITEYLEETYHPKAVARLRSYVAGGGFQGLMTAEGHVVTMPLYKNIEAFGSDLYLCEVTNGDKVIINGKGEIVK